MPPERGAAPAQSAPGSLRTGVGVGFAGSACSVVVGCAVGEIAPYEIALPAVLFPLILPGVVQFVWILPAGAYFWRIGQRETVKGLLVYAGCLGLLNATCFALR